MKGLTTYIFEQLKENKISQAEAKKLLQEIGEASKKVKDSSERPIAIVGMAARMPEADDIEAFWQNIRNGRDSVRPVPAERRKDLEMMIKEFFGQIPNVEFNEAAYLDRIDLFDPTFFNIPPGEAKYICPEQRMFIQVAWEALEDAGYSEKFLYGSKTGIYAGYTNSDYTKMIRGFEPVALTGNIASVTTARLAYIMNFSGPTPMIDTACSSSLVALHVACQGIRSGDCDMAIVGGVHMIMYPIKAYTSASLGIESADGRSRAFDASATGVGGGEGVLAIIIKDLEKALKDRDHVYAVIRGTAINSDGRSNGIAAPNALAQTRVIREAWDRAGVSLETASYMEAHGTGTRLGDPIEIEGLTGAFKAYTPKTRFCPIGSLKTNIGHLDSAAGIAGVVKTVLAMQHKELPPSIHFHTPNPFINFANAPVYVNDRLQPWQPESGPRRAGVSSFGLSGTNSHAVIEDAPEVKRNPEALPKGELLFTISAKTANAFTQLLEKYQQYFKNHRDELYSDICFTTNVGRGQYSYRLAIPVKNLQELEDKLSKVIANKGSWSTLTADGIYYGEVKRKAENTGEVKVEKGSDLAQIAQSFVTGTDLDWDAYYHDLDVRRVSIPTYAFDLKRLWIDYQSSSADPNPTYQEIASLGYRTEDIFGPQGKTHAQSDEAQGVAAAQEEVLIGDDIESRLMGIWSQVLGYDHLSVEDDFFELGGNSLNAMQIIAKIHKDLNIRLPLQQFLESPTIREMAIKLSVMEEENFAYIPVQEERDYYPLSSAQRRLFLITQHDTATYSYNLPGIMKVIGKLDRDRFNQAFKKLVMRHESFRASFETRDGELVQYIAKDVPFEVEFIEIDHFNVEEEMTRFMRPFDLSKAPLLRVRLFMLPNDEHIFLYDMHHIISDGVSFSIILREFAKLYAGEDLPPLRVQYKDFAIWQNDKWEKGELERLENYWLTELQGELPVLKLQTDFERPQILDHKGFVLLQDASSELYRDLQNLANHTGATLYMVLLAAYNVLLAKYSNQDDIIVGTPIAGRPHADLEEIVGMFVNTLALRNYPAHEKSFLRFLEEVRDRTIQAFEHQEYQFDMLVDKLGVMSATNRNPLFDTMFVVQNADKGMSLNLGEIALEPYPYDKFHSKFDITLSAYEFAGNLKFEFEFATALFTKKTIEKMVADFIHILEQITANPLKGIGEIEIESGLMILEASEIDDGDFNF